MNENEIIHFEDSFISDFLHDIHGFYYYIADICASGGEYGTSVLNKFKEGKFDRPDVSVFKGYLYYQDLSAATRHSLINKHHRKLVAIVRDAY